MYADYQAWLERRATSPVRVQWDPERDARLDPLSWRSIQVGLGGVAVDLYVDSWITGIDDITPMVEELRERQPDDRAEHLPVERPYPLPMVVAAAVGVSDEHRCGR